MWQDQSWGDTLRVMNKATKQVAEAMSDRMLERIVKGFANHRRIQMLRLLEQEPDLSLIGICRRLHVAVKTASEHLRRAALAELIEKRNEGRLVRHRLTERGISALQYLRSIR